MARREKGDIDKGDGQAGAIGMVSDAHKLQKSADRDAPELRGDLGVGGQRHPGGSSRDPAARGTADQGGSEG